MAGRNYRKIKNLKNNIVTCGECKYFRSGDDYPKNGCAYHKIDRKYNDSPLLKFCFEKRQDDEILKLKPEFHGIGIDLKELFKRFFK